MVDTASSDAIGDDTMAVRAQLRLCRDRLEKYEPNVACDVLNPSHLVCDIRRIFDEHHPLQSRAQPIPSRDYTGDTLCQAHGDIWNGVDSHGATDNSLRACCERVLVAAMGGKYHTYCREQSYCAIQAVRHALLGARLATRWEELARPPTQETIVWHILREHFTVMQHDIRMRLEVP